MDKNTWIGFALIAAIIVGFSFLNRPSEEELAERKRVQDSIALVQAQELEAKLISEQITAQLEAEKEATTSSEDLAQQLAAVYGPFAPATQGQEGTITLENEKVRIGVAYRGGRIAKAELKEYKAYGDSVNPLCLFQGDESTLNFTLVTNTNRILATQNLYFTNAGQTTDAEGNTTLTMRLNTNIEDCYLDFVYTLPADDYMVGMSIVPHNMQLALAQNMSSMEMQWNQEIPQQEKGRKFEERYAQLQYMFVGGDIDKLSEQKADRANESARIKWIAYKDQFFSTVMIAEDAFESTTMESAPLNANSHYIKAYKTNTSLPFDINGKQTTNIRYYFGPNHYNTLKAYDKDVVSAEKLHLNELVPLGWKLVAWINKILVIPMFDLFMSWGLHIGIVILLMTLVIKLIILPFVWASNKSSAKMRVLKPQLDEINAKYPPEKMQERQQATMELYQKAGVSPMSGCLPMLFQFPVLMAMFWFLPTAIELRGQSLFWADDLSTYDAILTWNRSIPIFGTHLSLFCLIMTIVNIVYTHITMQSQSQGQEMKMMRWMMYLMPLMFLFFFNDYAAGLSYYYFVSLLMTIIQTMIFRWTTDDKKVLAEMEANAKKKGSQKKSGFAARLEAMQREQQRLAREQAKAQQKKMR
ncbi:MAG: membrane protein insertase YidC [Paludibacteraceae bacterium]|nr:membrane protein insertase YidC [Paludibacteraceae bacterium]